MRVVEFGAQPGSKEKSKGGGKVPETRRLITEQEGVLQGRVSGRTQGLLLGKAGESTVCITGKTLVSSSRLLVVKLWENQVICGLCTVSVLGVGVG